MVPAVSVGSESSNIAFFASNHARSSVSWRNLSIFNWQPIIVMRDIVKNSCYMSGKPDSTQINFLSTM